MRRTSVCSDSAIGELWRARLREKRALRWMTATLAAAPLMLVAFSWGARPASSAQEETLPEGEWLAERINERRLRRPVSRQLTMKLVSPKGPVRTRKLESLRREKDGASQIAIYVLSPPSMKGTGFLCYDYFDSSRQDDQWIYEPSRQAVRRVPDTGRGDSFLGSEYTIEDIKKVHRIEIGEYQWKVIGREELDGERVYLLEQLPRDAQEDRVLGPEGGAVEAHRGTGNARSGGEDRGQGDRDHAARHRPQHPSARGVREPGSGHG